MKKILSILTIMLTAIVLVACTDTLAGVERIELSEVPKDVYELNEEVSLAEFVIKVKLEGQEALQEVKLTAADVKVTGATLVGNAYHLNTDKVGEFVFKVEYKGFKLEFQFRVVNSEGWDGTPEEVLPVNGVYSISTPGQFAFLSASTTPITGTIKLEADLDFNGQELAPIKQVQAPFIFDGNNHKISGLSATFKALVSSAILSNDSNVEFKNLTLENVHMDNNSNTAFLLYGNGGTSGKVIADNITVSGSFRAKNGVAGGLFGYIYTSNATTNPVTVEVKNSKIALNAVTVVGNTGLIIGHGSGTNLVIDQSSLNYLKQNSSVTTTLSGPGLLVGYFINTINGVSKTAFTDNNVNVTNIDKQTLTVGLGENIKFNKATNAKTAIVQLEFTINPGSYPIKISQEIDLTLFANGSEIISEIMRKYITQDSTIGNDNTHYLVNYPDYYIGLNVTLRVLQLDGLNVIEYRELSGLVAVDPLDIYTLSRR